MTSTRLRPRRTLLVVHPSDEMYGADKVLLEALHCLPEGIDVQVWLPTDVDYPRRELSTALAALGIRVRYLPMPILRRAYLGPAALPALAGRFVRALWQMVRLRPDFVYANTSATSLYVLLGRLVGARVIVHLHEYLDGSIRSIMSPFLRIAHRVVAVSGSVRDVLPQAVRARTVVIHNGFDLPVASPVPEAPPHRVLLASRWNAWKGHDVLLAAWARLQRRDLQLVILGGPPPSGAVTDVAALVHDLPNADTVVIQGQTAAVGDVMATCIAVVVPSTRPDPLPTIAIEALAAGRYLIASDSGGLPEIIGDGPGRLLPPGDVQAWVDALEALDAPECARIAPEARDRFETEFGVERFHREMRAMFEDQWAGLSWRHIDFGQGSAVDRDRGPRTGV